MNSREWASLPQETKDRILNIQHSVPVRLSALAEALGLSVLATVLPTGVSGEIRPDPTSAGRYIVRVNRNDPSRRQRFTVAHEIAHFLLHRELIGAGIKDDVLYRSNQSDRIEAQANRLAADLLMPEHQIENWLDKAKTLKVDDPIGFLADKFNVSEAAMKIRLGVS